MRCSTQFRKCKQNYASTGKYNVFKLRCAYLRNPRKNRVDIYVYYKACNTFTKKLTGEYANSMRSVLGRKLHLLVLILGIV